MISVIVPSYNSGRYLSEALGSVLQQLDKSDEVIIQDGGSNDETVSILQSFAAEDPRVKFFVESDAGQSDALNRALQRSCQKYVLWLNADDIVCSDAIEKLKAVLIGSDSSLDFVYGAHKLINSEGKTISFHKTGGFSRSALMLRGCYVFSGSYLIRRELLSEIGGFARDLHYCMDLDLLLRVAAVPSLTVRSMDTPVGALRWHDESKSGGQANRFVAEGWKVRKRHSESRLDLLLGVAAALIQSIAIGTTSFRHTDLYQRLRGRGTK
jgi:glycosyltransferase involved in cell wall biosynthesis